LFHALERSLAREQPVGDAAERIEIGRRAHRAVEDLLGRHPTGCAEPGALSREPRLALGRRAARESEVEHLDEVALAPVRAHEQVRWLEVAVREVVRVRLAERMADLSQPI